MARIYYRVQCNAGCRFGMSYGPKKAAQMARAHRELGGRGHTCKLVPVEQPGVKVAPGGRCPTHRMFNGCELPAGHAGRHKSGGLTWD
jgi:hypothetical protein